MLMLLLMVFSLPLLSPRPMNARRLCCRGALCWVEAAPALELPLLLSLPIMVGIGRDAGVGMGWCVASSDSVVAWDRDDVLISQSLDKGLPSELRCTV